MRFELSPTYATSSLAGAVSAEEKKIKKDDSRGDLLQKWNRMGWYYLAVVYSWKQVYETLELLLHFIVDGCEESEDMKTLSNQIENNDYTHEYWQWEQESESLRRFFSDSS